MSLFRAMSFDGGGVRGVLSATLLNRLDGLYPGLCKSTELFSGTSTGALIALGLAYGMEPSQLVDVYVKYSKYIFTPEGESRLRPKYSNAHLREVLCTLFPEDLRLADLKKYVVIPVFRVKGPKGGPWGPVFLTNLPKSRANSAKVIDVALATSAAPGLFPSYKGLVDGGVAAANPSMACLAAMAGRAGMREQLSNIRLLSIGTGYIPKSIKADTTDWGEIQWAIYPRPKFPLVSALFAAQTDSDSLYAAQMLGDHFFRLNPRLQRSVGTDDYKKIPYLVKVGDTYRFGPVMSWIEDEWFRRRRTVSP